MEESHIFKGGAVTTAVEVITGNLDLLSEILVRLPARSLVRFSLVCKSWLSRINSTHFRLRHCGTLAYSSAVSPSGIYFYNYLANPLKIVSLPLADNVTRLPPFPFPDRVDVIDAPEHFCIKVTQSCNGLLMCVASNIMGITAIGLVYNPAMREVHLLPNPYDKFYAFVHYNLVFDPSGPPYFKAVCVKRITYLADADVSVYVPGSDKSWRFCCRFSPPEVMYFFNGVFWNGVIHWISDHFSVYFDANSEKVGIKEKPPGPHGQCDQMLRYFGEWGGHLHLIQVQSLYAKEFGVLELDKDTLKWSVKYRVHLARLISAFPEMVQQRSGSTQYAFTVLSVIRGETEEDSVLLLTIPGKVVAYNLVHKTCKVVCELSGEIRDTLRLSARFEPISAFQYTENLVPVDKWNE